METHKSKLLHTLYNCRLILICILSLCNICYGQDKAFWERTHLGFGVGMNKLGGEGGFTYKNYPAFQSYLNYEITSHFALRGQLFYSNVGGAAGLGYIPASENGGTIGRIVNPADYINSPTNILPYQFKSRIEEISILPEFNLFDITTGQKKFTPYFFAGISFYHFNRYFLFPENYTDPTTGKHPKQENGGIYLPENAADDPKGSSHSSTLYNIPIGFGIKYSATKFIGFYAEFSRRILFTDYIDGYGSTSLFDNQNNDYYYPVMIGAYFRLGGFETSLFRKHPKSYKEPREKRYNAAKNGCPPVYL